MRAPIRNRHGERLDAAFHLPGAEVTTAPRAPLPETMVIVAHGVTSNKDRPWLVAIAEALAAAGIAAVRVSFSGNGRSEGRFEDCTPTKEVEDLGSVLDALDDAGGRRVGYVGHSMGGAVGVLAAERDPRIRCLVTLAGITDVQAFVRRTFGGLAFGEPMLDKPECPWSPALAEDAARIGSVTPQAARVTAPWLLVHGGADELVPPQDSLDARAAAGNRPDLVVLPGIDHRFTGAVPDMVEAVVSWIARTLTP